MNTGTRLLLAAAAGLLCLRARAQTVDPHLLDGMLEEPPGVKIVSTYGFVPSTEDPDPRYAAEDAAVTYTSQQEASLVLEVTGPRKLRMHQFSGYSDTGGYLWIRIDGKNVFYTRDPLPPSSDWTFPAGKHHFEIFSSVTPVALFKVED